MPYVTKNGKKKSGEFIYLPNDELTVKFLIDHARENHTVGKEGQTLLVIDEAGVMFNSRDYGCFDRKSWINFFMTHRHYGYNVILVSQVDRLLDKQIRAFIEYDVKHRKANNFRMIGFFLTLLHIPLFVAVTYWYGIRDRCGSELFRYRKMDGKLYDTMMLFGGSQHGQKIGGDNVVELPIKKQPKKAVSKSARDITATLEAFARGGAEPAQRGGPATDESRESLPEVGPSYEDMQQEAAANAEELRQLIEA